MAEESKDSAAATDIYNIEAAEILASEALHLPIAEATPIYEQLLTTFPTAAKYWKQYVEAYMAVNNDEATKQIFSRCLLNCLQVSLWRCYIRFIRKANDKKGAEGLEETKKAFEFMLNYVGADISSGPVWMEYIAFLKTIPATNAQEESHRMTSVRKVYQKAIVTPTHHIEQLWRDYENFENSVSRALAKGLVSEYQPKFNSARAVYRELKKYIDEIDWNRLAVPPTGSHRVFDLFHRVKRLLESIHFKSFNLWDLLAPDLRRTHHILSNIVNFLFYRDDKMNLLQPIVDEFQGFGCSFNELERGLDVGELAGVSMEML